MYRIMTLVAAAALLVGMQSDARADSPVLLAQSNTAIEKVFSDLERRVIREVLGAAGVDTVEDDDDDDDKDRGDRKAKGKGSKGAPPGLAKRDRLPPGLQRQLERNGRLPPGLEKKQFPRHLRAQLPAPLQGTERVIVDNDVVLIETATDVILDVIYDVVVDREPRRRDR